MNTPQGEPESRDLLSTLSDNALKLLAGFPSTPQALRIQVGEVSLDVQWPQVDAPGPTAAMTGATPTDLAAATDHATNHSGDHTASDSGTTPHDPAMRRVVAPMVGVFYRAPEPGASPFVEVGSAVKAGDQVGIVEAMKLMVPVRADDDGTVMEILKENGESVEYGEPLVAYKIS